MRRFAESVLRHRVLIALAWFAVAVAGAATASTTVDRLSFEFALPGQPAYETNQQITEQFGGGGVNDPLLLVVRGQDAQEVSTRVAALTERAVPGTRTVTAADPGAGVLAAGDSAVVVAYPPVVAGPAPYAQARPALERVAQQAGANGAEVTLSGFPVLAEGGGGDDRGLIVEVLIGAAGALMVLALVFGSLLAGVPLLVAAVSILGTFLALLGLTYVTDVSAVVEYLIALIGLGVAIDYSLLVVTRWREERAAGRGNDDAVRAAMETAGRSVLFSGITVAVSLAALVVVPLPFLRSIGLGGMLIPLLSVAVSLTLVPALLSALGPRLSWPRRSGGTTRSRLWAGVAGVALRHRWLTTLGSIAVLLALAAPAATLTLGSPQLSGLATGSTASRALGDAIDSGVAAGVARPTDVLLASSRADRAAQRIEQVPGVAAAVVPSGAGWSADGRSLVQVYGSEDPATDSGRAVLDRIRGLAAGPLQARVGGTPAEDADYISASYDDAVWVVLAVAVVTFLLLARALRSLWLPVKALALNALSLAAAYGVTVLIWQHGVGSQLLFGHDATGALTIWVPIAAFAFLFGLSMDYEVFLLSRMREEHDRLVPRGASDAQEREATDRSVVEGTANTGRLVTSAALILFFAFVALSTVPVVEVKILATALALGIAIDAVIVRGLLAPALVGILGRANWTMPGWLAGLVRVGERRTEG